MPGTCEEEEGREKEAVAGCFPNPEDCLLACQENTESTGCQFDANNKGCYITKTNILGIGGLEPGQNITCWAFIGKDFIPNYK